MTKIAKQTFYSVLFSACLSTSLALSAGLHEGGHDKTTSLGKIGNANNISKTVEINMTDNMRYSLDNLEIKQGETVRFIVKNTGVIRHEFVLGNATEIAEHYEIMKKAPTMKHDDDQSLSLAPNTSGEIIWEFTEAGSVQFACLEIGHYDAGMKGTIVIN